MPVSFPIYLVDDDPGTREWAQIMCEEAGLNCRTFDSGGNFLAAFDELRPGCILLDMRMPKPNGLSVQAALAARGSRMPVIAITGYGDVDVAVQSMKLGAIEFLEKPFTLEVLWEAIKQAFDRLRQLPSA